MSNRFSIVILPFLKTSGSVSLGGVTFRSTDDTDGLPEDQAAAVQEVSRMFFVQDDLRIKVASYAVVPFVDLDRAPHDTEQLENIQSVLAYLYSSPHEIYGTPFLHSEHASVVVFTPSVVSVHLIRPMYNVVLEDARSLEVDDRQKVRGYAGLYNFRHHFLVAPGSRVYGPLPRPVLNIAQDLQRDVERATAQVTYRLLFGLLEKPRVPAAVRVLTGLRWYNSAHRKATDDCAAIVHLAIAFEALLGLPHSEKTDRLVDAISLLLGRVPRLDAWAQQFYDARSRIVHEGYADDLHFVASAETRKQEGQLYQSLFSYGTQVFRLCLGTLLLGSNLADQAGLEERFVTNQERYNRLCQLFDNETLEPYARLESAEELVDAIERYQFVGETGLRLETMIGAIRLGARTLLDSGIALESPLANAFTALARSATSRDSIAGLDAIHVLEKLLPDTPRPDAGPEDVIRRLVKAVWGSVFMHYYWIKKQQQSTKAEGDVPDEQSGGSAHDVPSSPPTTV
jgi:hypothetical protein